DGKMVKNFEEVHEKRVHLIIVRDGLDHFAHVHPDLDTNGTMTMTFTFPVGGKYRLYADHKPVDADETTAIASLEVAGNAPPAPKLITDVPGKVAGDGLEADVQVEQPKDLKADGQGKVVFQLHDQNGQPIADLQP